MFRFEKFSLHLFWPYIEADQPGKWASSGEIHATARLLRCRIAVFTFDQVSKINEWSWYPSPNHYTDRPIITLYNPNADHFLVVDRIKTAILIS